MEKKINLIWQTNEGDQTTFEFDYVTELLFDKFEQTRIFDFGSLSTVLDNSVIIYSNNSKNVNKNFIKYLGKFVEKKYKFYLLHLSNENLNHDTSYYELATHVFRNYHDQNIKNRNVTFIPLGVKSGFIKKNNHESLEKKYNFAFIGQPKSDRYELLEIIENDSNNFIHKTNSWNCTTSLSQNECSEIYSKTKFVPCPMGWVHPDSFRIMESLESGSIPVIKKYNNQDFLKNTFGSHPLPMIENWSELKKLNEVNYEELHLKVQTWYTEFKENIKNVIYETIGRNAPTVKPKKIKLSIKCWWTDSENLHKRFIKQFVPFDDLETYDFVSQNPDYTIVLGRTDFDSIETNKSKTFYFSQEPIWSPNENRMCHDYCSKIFVSDKKYLPNREEYIETLIPMLYAGHGEDHFEKKYDWGIHLREENYEKTKNMSVIVRKGHQSHLNHLEEPNRFKIIYGDRSDLAEKVSLNENIDIFGVYWEKNQKNIKGEIFNKKVGLADYRFSLCMENTIQNNYISEKFWDCILTDTVPVYIGCKNINNYVDETSFVNLTTHYNQTEKILSQIKFIANNSERMYNYYIPKIKKLKEDFFTKPELNLWIRIKNLLHENS